MPCFLFLTFILCLLFSYQIVTLTCKFNLTGINNTTFPLNTKFFTVKCQDNRMAMNFYGTKELEKLMHRTQVTDSSLDRTVK